MKIWSIRTNVALGNHWQYERDCKDEDVQQWLKIFRSDEPTVLFLASLRKPCKP